jgi:peptidoglycan/xylan/chitin deacetylase (PgdA/CDA1 family)
MYHRVIEENEKEDLQPGLYVTKNVFERQMAYIARKYRPSSMSDFCKAVLENQSFPRNTVLLTFDDGWRDNYLNAFPALKKHNVPATIFLTIAFIGSDRLFWFQELSTLMTKNYHLLTKYADAIENVLKKYPNSKSAQNLLSENIQKLIPDRNSFIEKLKYLDMDILDIIIAEMKNLDNTPHDPLDNERLLLNWDEVKQMSKDNIEFGSHGLSHRLLTLLNDKEIISELSQSKKTIEKMLGTSVSAFTYPNGDHNTEIKKLTEHAGYICAFATGKHPEDKEFDKFAIERVGIHNDISIGIRGNFSKAMFALHIERHS